VVFDSRMFILHLLPYGILLLGKKCVIGNGVVIDPEALRDEVRVLKKEGISVAKRLFVSQSAHIILPYHRYLDKLKEKGSLKIGTTGKGIGPAYSDKVARIGIRVADFLDKKTFIELLDTNLREKKPLLDKICSTDELYKQIITSYPALAAFIAPFVADCSVLLNRAIDRNKNILFESAQGTMLDVDFGSYPYVTSSSPIAGGVSLGTGVPPTRIDEILGVIKAYTTRVGEGPFPTEQQNRIGEYLREQGKEFGATTGRPRRCGWFDCVVATHAVRINGIKKLALTKLDVLAGIDPINICVAYKYQGKIIKEFPAAQRVLAGCTPVYITMPGFGGDIHTVTRWQQLPRAAQQYVQKLEKLVGSKFSLVSMGRSRDETIMIDKNFKWI
jgi:adenylosuccinate synthase